MNSVLKYNFNKICRACKIESEELQSLFENLNEYPILAEMLMLCTSVQVQLGDGLPTSMCTQCVDQLNKAYNFKKKCESTDSVLRLCLKESEIKKESNSFENDDYEFVFNSIEDDDKSIKDGIDDFIGVSEFKSELDDENSSDINKSSDDTLNCFKCKVCSKQFEVRNHLECHLKTHQTQKKTYICKICNKRLSKLEYLKRHMTIHLKMKPYLCTICKRGFTHFENRNNHEKKCKGDRIYVCEICNRGFNRPDGLTAHMGNHESNVDVKPMLDSLENIEKYILIENSEPNALQTDYLEPQVNIVENSISNEPAAENLQDSVVKNTDSKFKRGRPRKAQTCLKLDSESNSTSKYICKICQKKFDRSNHLKRHMLVHAGMKPFSCYVCSKRFTRRDHLLRHGKLHDNIKEFKCDLCTREFHRSEQLQQHKAVRHMIGEKKSTAKKYPCDICNKSFTTEKYRDTHVKAHSEIAKEKEFTCKACFMKFESRNDLQDHEKQNIECSKKYLCCECGQRFMKKNYLVVHMRRHRGEKPYKCKFCGKGFPRSTDVTRHEKYHTGEKNHLCIICGKGFGRAYNLTLHMRTHTGEKPYSCSYCEAAFAQSNDLKAHIRRHTGERYHCDLCNNAFLMGYLLKQHKKNAHGIDCTNEHFQPFKKEENIFS